MWEFDISSVNWKRYNICEWNGVLTQCINSLKMAIIIYRLMHVFFQIKTVIPRDRYRPDGFSPRVDIGWGFCFRNANKSFLAERRHFPNTNWQLSGSDVMWHDMFDIVLSEFCPDGRYRCGTSGVYVRYYLYICDKYRCMQKFSWYGVDQQNWALYATEELY